MNKISQTRRSKFLETSLINQRIIEKNIKPFYTKFLSEKNPTSIFKVIVFWSNFLQAVVSFLKVWGKQQAIFLKVLVFLLNALTSNQRFFKNMSHLCWIYSKKNRGKNVKWKRKKERGKQKKRKEQRTKEQRTKNKKQRAKNKNQK